MWMTKNAIAEKKIQQQKLLDWSADLIEETYSTQITWLRGIKLLFFSRSY